MATAKSERLPLSCEEDVVRMRRAVRTHAVSVGLSLVDQTKIVTAASEIGRNTLVYGGGGEVLVETLEEGGRKGVRLTFEDKGPGIPDLEAALRDGFTTGSGLGLGLGGARRLSSEFRIQSEPGQGTRIVLSRWNR